MKLENKRKIIIEYGDVGARPVTSAAASLKNAGDYEQLPKTSEKELIMRNAYEDVFEGDPSYKFADFEGSKLKIRAGTERSTIPNAIDEISDDYDYGEEHHEYQFNFLPQLAANQRKNNVPSAANTHDIDSITHAIKSAPVTYVHPEKMEGIHNLDNLGAGQNDATGEWWSDANTNEKLDHVKDLTWNYKKDTWKERHGDSAREKFSQHFDGLAKHIASGENSKESSMYPSVMIKLPSNWQTHENVQIGDTNDVNSLITSGETSKPGEHQFHLMGGNTRSMIHQALNKPIPFKVIQPFRPVKNEHQLKDLRYRGKLLTEKMLEESKCLKRTARMVMEKMAMATARLQQLTARPKLQNKNKSVQTNDKRSLNFED
tara:strand:- start:6584 stop:7705 length:1122 start_codon:yes stop_codon:yes gene_type:complete